MEMIYSLDIKKKRCRKSVWQYYNSLYVEASVVDINLFELFYYRSTDREISITKGTAL
jgi:hypothetical protein